MLALVNCCIPIQAVTHNLFSALLRDIVQYRNQAIISQIILLPFLKIRSTCQSSGTLLVFQEFSKNPVVSSVIVLWHPKMLFNRSWRPGWPYFKLAMCSFTSSRTLACHSLLHKPYKADLITTSFAFQNEDNPNLWIKTLWSSCQHLLSVSLLFPP